MHLAMQTQLKATAWTEHYKSGEPLKGGISRLKLEPCEQGTPCMPLRHVPMAAARKMGFGQG